MPPSTSLRPATLRALRNLPTSSSSTRSFSTTSSLHTLKKTSPQSPPRHFLSIADLTPNELAQLVLNASQRSTQLKSNHVQDIAWKSSLQGKTVAMMFNKRSTRTRVSTEAAVTAMGGHPMFLGKDDIQLGVNESLYDTSRVISSMTSCMVARVGPHSDVANLAKDSSVPVINALSNDYHPLQTIADYLTIYQTFVTSDKIQKKGSSSLGLAGLKIAWIGDSNNVLFDLAIGAMKLGIHISVASPVGYGIPPSMAAIIKSAAAGVANPGTLTETTVPEEATKDADILVTDTWVSMGQEEETAKRIKAFEGFQITHELAKRGGAKEGWKFMHCLPRHHEEVDDKVFYDEKKSLVFNEAENRLYAAVGKCFDPFGQSELTRNHC